MPAERVHTDSLHLTRDEAAELMIHHLRLAAMLFEATPEDNGTQVNDEIDRLHGTEIWAPAARMFNSSLVDAYNRMKDRDGG
jgi:hypothetical protein